MNSVIIEQLLRSHQECYNILESRKENSQKRIQQLRNYRHSPNTPTNNNVVSKVVNWFKSFF
jgi:hypothetical protein